MLYRFICIWTLLLLPIVFGARNRDYMWYPNMNSTTKQVIHFAYLGASESDEYQREKQARVISGALTYAVEQINNDTTLLPNHTLAFNWSDTKASELVGLNKMCHLWSEGVYAFLGPEIYCGVAARLSAAWNIPMISYKCANHEVSNKTLYPTFARTFPPANQVTKFIVSLLLAHNWRQFSLVVGSSTRLMEIKAKLIHLCEQFNLTINNITTYTEPYIPVLRMSEIPGIVNSTYAHTRIYVFLGKQNGIADFLCNLHDIGLLANGKYMVIYVDHLPYDVHDSYRYFKRAMDDPTNNNKSCSAAARSLLVLSPQVPLNPSYDAFQQEVNRYNVKPPFNFPNPFNETKKIPLFAAHLYDAIFLYARCIHEMLMENLDIKNGTAVISRIRNRTFQSIQGFQSHIDENGDALGNYSILAWKEGTPVNGTANFSMNPVGSFTIDPSQILPTFQLNEGSRIAWMNGKPPLDTPPCGYYNEKCQVPKDNTLSIVLGAFGGTFVLAIIVGIILYKRWRYEQAIAGLLWKVCPSDLHIVSDKTSTESKSASKYSLCSRLSLDSRMSMTQVYARTGSYKGQIVALKMYEKKHFVLTHKMKKEMKIMRDIRHNNVNAFVGACVDPPHFIIVTEYCAKGSLQDVLENEDMKLDDMFIASLVKDLMQGMIFIHDSELGYHGNLKSSNCVINSRWTLQVADYGILDIRAATYRKEDEHAYYRNLQWTAPEILRCPEKRASPKADIYSFGIVLYEILSRSSPYRDLNVAPKEIIERVEKGGEGGEPFRPNIQVLNSDSYLVDCMKVCWNECPEVRPDFRTVWRMLKPLRQGMKRNIFDNMMSMMERYQCNLEELVGERTELLIEEKKKTEMLLLRMLPKSVAETLKRGQPVEPESYQQVTIYFSDICGFTAISAESTPMQVVALLNDLYTLFDSIIHNYDVYKVETIGDAYMVVSGLPIRNSDNHAGEIASMSLHLLSAIKTFKISYKPNEVLRLRIGIHSGPCVAGVVGLIMPRYCLFGDTVNTASRMESNGESLKIHCSEETKLLLDKLGGYILDERGLVSMKGKGELRTFWLLDEIKEVRQRRLKNTRREKNSRPPNNNQPHPRTNSWKRNAFHRKSRETESFCCEPSAVGGSPAPGTVGNSTAVSTTTIAAGMVTSSVNSLCSLKRDGSFFDIIRDIDGITGGTGVLGSGYGGVRNKNDSSLTNISIGAGESNMSRGQPNSTTFCRACSVKEKRSNNRDSPTKSTRTAPFQMRLNNAIPTIRVASPASIDSSHKESDADCASERDCLLTKASLQKRVSSGAVSTLQQQVNAPRETSKSAATISTSDLMSTTTTTSPTTTSTFTSTATAAAKAATASPTATPQNQSFTDGADNYVELTYSKPMIRPTDKLQHSTVSVSSGI